ncbi:MAG: transposase [Saprospiraceae bacterium]|jgi:transposase|nr:transposase [Saprospiraceae bacterium]
MKHLLVSLKSWVEEQSVYVLPQSPIGKAMAYFHTQWPKIMELFNDGRYELVNNLIENKIRPLALGRKNYLFAGSHEGAQRIAMMYSFLGSCAANDINPMSWLENTLEKINETKLKNLKVLLPLKQNP